MLLAPIVAFLAMALPPQSAMLTIPGPELIETARTLARDEICLAFTAVQLAKQHSGPPIPSLAALGADVPTYRLTICVAFPPHIAHGA